jgi:Spore coat polysaccharide biosynthesis protein F, CMP-KDO synthetase homolog
MPKVLIGVQARSDSKRLPGKAHLSIGNKTILQWVLDNCNQAIRYLTQSAQRDHMELQVSLALLVPHNDSIAKLYTPLVRVIEGDHDDVLGRYVEAQKVFQADYIVRVTADCLKLPSYIISKHARSAVLKERDYTTNTHYRTFKEGWDCEVISKRLLHWLDENAKSAHDREHVTTLIAADQPFPFVDMEGKKNICHIINSEDESLIKTSIDTEEEYRAAQKAHENFMRMRASAKRDGIFQL